MVGIHIQVGNNNTFQSDPSILRGFQLPGTGVAIKPKVWEGFKKGKEKSFGHFLHAEKESTLLKMRNVCENVKVLDRKVRKLYNEAECVKNIKKSVEHQLSGIQDDDINRLKLSEMPKPAQIGTETSTVTKEKEKESTAEVGAAGLATEQVSMDVDESREEIIVIQLNAEEADEDKKVQLVSSQKLPQSLT